MVRALKRGFRKAKQASIAALASVVLLSSSGSASAQSVDGVSSQVSPSLNKKFEREKVEAAQRLKSNYDRHWRAYVALTEFLRKKLEDKDEFAAELAGGFGESLIEPFEEYLENFLNKEEKVLVEVETLAKYLPPESKEQLFDSYRRLTEKLASDLVRQFKDLFLDLGHFYEAELVFHLDNGDELGRVEQRSKINWAVGSLEELALEFYSMSGKIGKDSPSLAKSLESGAAGLRKKSLRMEVKVKKEFDKKFTVPRHDTLNVLLRR